MKKEDRPIFARNLIKARKANGWNQFKAADMLGISRSAYASYEEGRALPALTFLPAIVNVFGITNITAFLENPDFSWRKQADEYTVEYESQLEMKYANARKRDQKIIDAILQIGNKP